MLCRSTILEYPDPRYNTDIDLGILPNRILRSEQVDLFAVRGHRRYIHAACWHLPGKLGVNMLARPCRREGVSRPACARPTLMCYDAVLAGASSIRATGHHPSVAMRIAIPEPARPSKAWRDD